VRRNPWPSFCSPATTGAARPDRWSRSPVPPAAGPILPEVTALAAPDAGYLAATTGCALLDRSERGKLALTGTGAKEFLQGQVSNDVVGLSPGSGCYAALLTPKGKMLADLRILDTGDELLLDTERSTLQELFNVIRRFSLGHEVALHKRTLERGLLSLLGPEAARLAGAPGLGAAEHSHLVVQIGAIEARAIRTDLGLDLLCDAALTDELAAALQRAGAQAISEQTADILRIERGRPRYGIDLDDTVIPQEAGLNDRAVSFTKGCYVGQETVARLFYRGRPTRHLRGLRLSAPTPVGADVVFGERVVGTLGSVALSPAAGCIGLSLLRREAAPGAEVMVGPDAVPATVVELPFLA
jgi:folate-binding protein YgfZ